MMPQDAAGRTTETGRTRWRTRSLAPPAFDPHQGRRYEQLLMFPAAWDGKTTPAKERTAIDARRTVGVSNG